MYMSFPEIYLFVNIVIQNEIFNLFKRLWDSIKDFFSK